MDAKKRADDAQMEKNRASEDLRTLKPECDRLKRKLDDSQRNLEDETLKRIDLQNQLQTAQEEAKFNNTVLTQQLNESKVRKQLCVVFRWNLRTHDGVCCGSRFGAQQRAHGGCRRNRRHPRITETGS